jgi:hypothetical protein
MCRRAGILSPQLAHYLTLAAKSCLSCLRTARPKPSKKISLSNVNREFNNSMQVDIFYLDGVDRRPILHAVDTHTSFSMARRLDYAKTGTLSCWQVRLSVNECMFTDHKLRCRVTRSLPKVTSMTCCVATISLTANKVHADITKRESLSEAMVF